MEKLREFIEKKKEKSASRRPRYGTRKLSVGLVSCVLGYCIFFSPTVVSAQVGEGSESTSTRVEASADTSDSDSESESDETKAVETPSAATNEVESPQAKASVSEVADEAPAVAETPVAEAEKEAPAEEVVEAEKEEPAVSEEKLEPVAEEDAETKEVSKKEEIEALKANKEANIEETVAADKKENKTEETTPKAEENKDALKSEDDKEAIVEDEKVEETEAAKVEKTETQAEPTSKEVANEELLLNEKPEPEALQAGETEEDAITNVEITIGGAKNGEKTEIVNPTALPKRTNEGNTDINLEARVDFDIPEGTKHGKTFDFVVSDNVNLHGVLKSEEEGQPVVFDGEEIATAERLTDGRNGYKYTFNEKVDNLKDIRVRIIYPLFIDPDKVPMGTKEYEIGEDGKYKLDNEGNPILKADNKEKVSVTVAGKTASKDYTVEYESEVFDVKTTGPTLSGIADIDQVDDNNYNHTIYVNPTADQLLNGSHVTVQNEKGYKTVTFDEDVKNSVKVYKVKDPNKLPLSFGNDFNDGNYEDVTSKANVKLVKDNNNADLNKLVVDVKQGNSNQSQPFYDKDFDKSTYVITYTGKRTPNKAFKTNTIFTADWRKANGNVKNLSKLGDQSWEWTNEIVIDDADAIAIANRTYSLGDKVWIDADEDGSQGDSEVGLEGVKVILKGINMSDKETKTDSNGNYKFEGLRNGEYTVEFEIPTGYAPTTVKAEGVTDKNNSDASQAQGSKVATAIGEINGADNMNVDFGVVKSNEGTFTEEHIYKTLDFEGKVVETSDPEQGEHKEGSKDVQYTTKAKEKEGFKLVSVEANDTDAVIDSENGTAKTGNIVEGKDLKVTYTYEKQPGRFVEHHIYKTVDKEGNVLTTDKTVNLPEDGQDPFEGYSSEAVNTKQRAEEGYTFKEATEIKLQNDDSEKIYTNYVPGKVLEKTYIYTKTQEEPVAKKGSFKETHVYITKDFDGNVIEDKTITEPGKSSEGTKDKTYESSKVDKAGYELVKVTADKGSENDVTISEDGKQVEAGNYVEDKELAVTYEYVKQPGRFVEHHIYKTVDKDGNEVSTDKTVNNPKEGEPAKEGFSNEKITTAQRPEDGYTFDSETTLESENYVPGKVLEKTYIYTKTQEEPVAKKGSFKETHVYITKDFDGNVIEDKTITEPGKSSEGTKDKTYESSKVDKAGYELVKVTADKGSENDVTISEDGKQVEAGNYVEDKELAVTYEYVKQPGRFVEHHIYKTVDKEGNVLTTDKTVNLPEDGQDPFEGYSSEAVNTKQRAEEGYTFKEATEIKLQNDDSEKIYTNYVPGKVLEKTYIYTKTEEGTPLIPLTPAEEPETPTPVEPSEPEEPKHTTPLVPLTPAEEVEVERITHHDHKTPGTPVVTEVPSTPVVETEKSVEEKTEKSEETKEVENKEEKAEKVEEIKEEAKTVEDDNLEKPQAPESHDKLAPRAPEKDKAPKTGDAGILSSLGLGSLAASGLAFIELKKRNKKNK